MDSQFSKAEALAISGGRILAVGANYQIEAFNGSLESGKYANLIMVDRDVSTCPVDEVRTTKVLLSMVGGKVVWQA